MTIIEQQIAMYLSYLDQRVSRLETLEQPAGGVGGGDLFLIETKTLTVPGIIQFLNIPSTAKSILYTGFLLGDGNQMFMIINGGTTATDLSNVYAITTGFGGGCATTINNVRMGVCQAFSDVGLPADVFGSVWGWIPDMQDATNHPGTGAYSGTFDRDDFVFNCSQGRGGGNWDKSGPVTQIDITHDGGVSNTWEAGSRFSLYGLTS